jgi:hypothetical protein
MLVRAICDFRDCVRCAVWTMMHDDTLCYEYCYLETGTGAGVLVVFAFTFTLLSRFCFWVRRSSFHRR